MQTILREQRSHGRPIRLTEGRTQAAALALLLFVGTCALGFTLQQPDAAKARKTPPAVDANASKRRATDVSPPRRLGRTEFFRQEGCLTTFDCELDVDYAPDALTKPELVVIGRVTEAKAFETDDGAGVYSQFTLSVETVVRGDPGAAKTLTLLRSGGTWSGNGRTKTLSTNGHGYPKRSERYAVFASRSKWSQDDWLLHTAFEIQNGHLSPIDDADVFSAVKAMSLPIFIETFRDRR
jgi:hypothetical protein